MLVWQVGIQRTSPEGFTVGAPEFGGTVDASSLTTTYTQLIDLPALGPYTRSFEVYSDYDVDIALTTETENATTVVPVRLRGASLASPATVVYSCLLNGDTGKIFVRLPPP